MNTRHISAGIALTVMALAATSAFASNYGNHSSKATSTRRVNDNTAPIVTWGDGGAKFKASHKNNKASKGKPAPVRHLNDSTPNDSTPIVTWGDGGKGH